MPAWTAFHRIRQRKGGGMGPSPIEWPDIDAFLRRSGVHLAPWEIDLLELLDDTWMRVVTAKTYDWKPEGGGDV